MQLLAAGEGRNGHGFPTIVRLGCEGNCGLRIEVLKGEELGVRVGDLDLEGCSRG